MQIQYDFSALNKALSQKIQLPRVPVVADILQDAALKILIGSGSGAGLVGLTRKATKERIKADQQTMVAGKNGQLRPRVIWEAIGWLKGRGMKITQASVSESAKLILKMRIKSRAYIAAGWLWCARDLYEKSPALQKKHSLTRLKARNMPMVDKDAKGSAANSFATPVKINGYTASLVLTNTSRGGGTVGIEYVQQAIDNATRDVMQYVDNKVAVGIVKEMFRGVNCKISVA